MKFTFLLCEADSLKLALQSKAILPRVRKGSGTRSPQHG